MLKSLSTITTSAAGVVATLLPVRARKREIFTGFFSALAIGGYDAVAYFTAGKPVKGKVEFSTAYKGASWRFATVENLLAFEANPAAYAPQYGGYCAWAMSENYTAAGDPNHWRIVDGKLYLNYDKNVQETWEKDITGFIAKADKNWPGVLGK